MWLKVEDGKEERIEKWLKRGGRERWKGGWNEERGRKKRVEIGGKRMAGR